MDLIILFKQTRGGAVGVVVCWKVYGPPANPSLCCFLFHPGHRKFSETQSPDVGFCTLYPTKSWSVWEGVCNAWGRGPAEQPFGVSSILTVLLVSQADFSYSFNNLLIQQIDIKLTTQWFPARVLRPYFLGLRPGLPLSSCEASMSFFKPPGTCFLTDRFEIVDPSPGLLWGLNGLLFPYINWESSLASGGHSLSLLLC